MPATGDVSPWRTSAVAGVLSNAAAVPGVLPSGVALTNDWDRLGITGVGVVLSNAAALPGVTAPGGVLSKTLSSVPMSRLPTVIWVKVMGDDPTVVTVEVSCHQVFAEVPPVTLTTNSTGNSFGASNRLRRTRPASYRLSAWL